MTQQMFKIEGRCAWCEEVRLLAPIKTGDPEIEELVCKECHGHAGNINGSDRTINQYRRANYSHMLAFSQDKDAEQASRWVQNNLDLSNEHQTIDCSVVYNEQPVMLIFFTERPLFPGEISLFQISCSPLEDWYNQPPV